MNERIIADSTAQHSTAQHSTAQHSTAQAKVALYFDVNLCLKSTYKIA